ncbi:MAG: MBL fold metallo-hydrolase, partial [Oscillospiraceae bacterium]
MPRFTTLYSGSSGNSGIAEENGRFLMIDMGASCRTTVAALTELELSVNQLGGILVTHEHSDHIKGLKVF